MAFIDEINIHMKAGDGGNGVVRWLQEKGKDKGGPAGGNGGGGGSVFIHAVRDLSLFSKYKNIKEMVAENGGHGMKRSMHGKNGEDLIVDLPIGSVLTNLSNNKKYSLNTEGEQIMILEGGRGGLGNEHFKASTNVRPKEFTNGKEGDSADFYIELELVADLGLMGLPNAGKSSLLNALTNAKAKIGSYAFTTLEPNLGDMYGFIIADIPGLIEGASEGKGLGHKFLRHIKRTKTLLHCISTENPDVVAAYKTVRGEISEYGEGLADKKEIIILTKTDAVEEKVWQDQLKKLKKINKDIYTVSVIDDASVKTLRDNLILELKKLD
jgi:GTP-binding protein